MSTQAIADQINTLRERLGNIRETEKSKEAERESIKQELRKLIIDLDAAAEAESEEMQQAAQQLQADIEKAEAEQKRREAELQKNRALLKENVDARIQAAGEVDPAVKNLAAVIEKYLTLAGDTDALAAAAGAGKTAATAIDRAKVDVSTSVRAGMSGLDLPSLYVFVPVAERMSFAEREAHKMSFYNDIHG